MSYTLKNNAYHILGLETTATEKEIFRRSKEIINRLKIDDLPEYDLDVGLFDNFRTEESVKEAIQKLQTPKKRIREYFFWFQVVDGVDEEAFKFIKQKDYPNAVRIWRTVSEGNSAKAFIHKRNLAVLYSLLLAVDNNKEYLRESLSLWKVLTDADKFWIVFEKSYELHHEQTAGHETITDLRTHVVGYLSDMYAELHQLHKDANYINDFQKIFSARGERVEKTVLGPAYQAINESVEGLEKMRISEDGVIDDEESNSIKKFVGIIKVELNKLIDLGLYDDSQTKVMRDRGANALRSVVLDLHNNLSELDKSQKLLQVAVQIAGTESLKNKLKGELEQIQENISEDAENTLAIDVPGTFGGGTVIFKNSYLEYNNKRIFYKDAVSTSFHAVNRSVNFIPISQSFSFMVASRTDKISFSFGTTLHIGKKEKQETWAKIANVSMHLIQPIIVQKLVDRIFDRDETVNIGGVEFTKEGYSRSKFFGGKETVLWTGKLFIPELDSGNVILWKDTGKQFTTVEMSVPNAVVMPDLVQACYDRASNEYEQVKRPS